MASTGMDDPAVRALLDARPPHTAKVGTIGPDGAPHVAPVWFALDGDRLVFTTGADTVKGRNLRRDRRVAVSVDDERPPFAFVSVQGRATLVDDLDRLRRWAEVIGGRYMGPDRAGEYGARNGVPGELLVVVEAQRVVCAHDLAL